MFQEMAQGQLLWPVFEFNLCYFLGAMPFCLIKIYSFGKCLYIIDLNWCAFFFNVCSFQGAVLCDIILLNFLKGADQYKARKFEEVWVFVFFPLLRFLLVQVFVRKKNSSFCFPSFARCQMHTLKNHPPTWAACTGPEITASCQSDLKTNSLMTQGLFPLDSMVNIFRIPSSNTYTPYTISLVAEYKYAL